MTRDDLIKIVQTHNPGASKDKAAATVDHMLREISETLTWGEEVKLFGLGRFSVDVHGPRMGRHPKTGEAVIISERKKVRFTPHGALRQATRAQIAA